MRKPRLREAKSVPEGDSEGKTVYMERIVHKMAQGMRVFCELGKGWERLESRVSDQQWGGPRSWLQTTGLYHETGRSRGSLRKNGWS